MQLCSLYIENIECSYSHCTVKIMNGVIFTVQYKIFVMGFETCIGLTSRSTAQRSDNYATPAHIIQRC